MKISIFDRRLMIKGKIPFFIFSESQTSSGATASDHIHNQSSLALASASVWTSATDLFSLSSASPSAACRGRRRNNICHRRRSSFSSDGGSTTLSGSCHGDDDAADDNDGCGAGEASEASVANANAEHTVDMIRRQVFDTYIYLPIVLLFFDMFWHIFDAFIDMYSM